MGVDVDDTHSAFTYSGSWSTYSSSQQYGGSGHSTTSNGASVTFNFQGSGIRLYCTVPAGSDKYVTARIIFDGKVKEVSHKTHPNDFNNDIWFDSAHIDEGRHTIQVINTSTDGAPLIIDRVNIDGSPIVPVAPTTRPPLAANPPPTTQRPPPTTQQAPPTAVTSDPPTALQPSTENLVPTGVSSGRISSGLSSVLPSSISPGSSAAGEKTVTAILFVTTSADGSVSTQSSLALPAALAESSGPPIGAIVGGVLGGLAILAVTLLLLLCLRRKQRRGQHIILPDEAELGQSSRPRRPTSVTPFQLARQPSTAVGSSSSGDESGSRSRDEMHGHVLPAAAGSSKWNQYGADPIPANATQDSASSPSTLSPSPLYPYPNAASEKAELEASYQHQQQVTSPGGLSYASPMTAAPFPETSFFGDPALLALMRQRQERHLSGDTAVEGRIGNPFMGRGEGERESGYQSSEDLPPAYQSVRNQRRSQVSSFAAALQPQTEARAQSQLQNELRSSTPPNA